MTAKGRSKVLRLLLMLPGVLLLWVGAAGVNAQPLQDFEHIRDFRVQIAVQPDGGVMVTEEIEVLALGRAIRRGIYRDLIRDSYDLLGLFAPAFELLEAQRDDRPEDVRIEETASGLRLYLGDPERLLEPGVYRYRLRYRMADQIDRLEALDELYWNANGAGWDFAILRLVVEVTLPPGAEIRQYAGYTGYFGESGTDFRAEPTGPGRLFVATTRPLAPGENLTIAVGWPQGFVTAPASAGWWSWLQTRDPVMLPGGLLLLLGAYYLLVWWRVDRDPPAGTIVPIYRPGLPPAAMRFIRRMGFDDDCVASALLSLAVKGHVVFEEGEKGELTLRRAVPPDGGPEASPGEAVLYNALLGKRGSLKLDRSNQAILHAARTGLNRHFQSTFDRVFFRRNRGFFVLGVVLTLVGWLLFAIVQPVVLPALLHSLWLGILTIVVMVVVLQLPQILRAGRISSGAAGTVGIVVLVLVGVILGGAVLSGLVQMVEDLDWPMSLAVLGVGGLNVLFFYLLKAPTVVGRDALDEIEGTRRYLTIAEADRLRFHNPPERTPEHFEALLPYAVALGVETEWTRNFADLLARSATPAPETGYQPRWYRGRRFRGEGLAGLGHALGTRYAGAAASRSNGSGGRSGSGGGGSSGGGRGGGGGGGW